MYILSSHFTLSNRQIRFATQGYAAVRKIKGLGHLALMFSGNITSVDVLMVETQTIITSESPAVTLHLLILLKPIDSKV
jgi:hypothetical protein